MELARFTMENRRARVVEHESAYVGTRQALELQVSRIDRDLATLPRMVKLAMEWLAALGILPKVRLLPD